MAVGMTLVPLGIILWFKAHGALQPMLNGTIWFNMEPNTTERPYRMFSLVPALLTLLWLDSRMKRWAPASPLTGCRRVLFLTVGVFLILELTVWPVDRWQDFLPFWPMLTILFVAAAEGMAGVLPAKQSRFRPAALPGSSGALSATVSSLCFKCFKDAAVLLSKNTGPRVLPGTNAPEACRILMIRTVDYGTARDSWSLTFKDNMASDSQRTDGAQPAHASPGWNPFIYRPLIEGLQDELFPLPSGGGKKTAF